MNTDWNNKEQLERFLSLQRKKPEMPVQHTRELWDRWAHNWESGLREDEARKERSRKRITATAEFLRSHGLLGADCEVIDIGCGPGRFVAEFAENGKICDGYRPFSEHARLRAGFSIFFRKKRIPTENCASLSEAIISGCSGM